MTPELATSTAPVITQGMMIGLGILMVRDAVWKAIGLRKSGTQKRLARFICIFIFNTAGILPIIYLAFFQKKGK